MGVKYQIELKQVRMQSIKTSRKQIMEVYNAYKGTIDTFKRYAELIKKVTLLRDIIPYPTRFTSCFHSDSKQIRLASL